MTREEAKHYIGIHHNRWEEPIFNALDNIISSWENVTKKDIENVLRNISYSREELANMEVCEFTDEDMYEKVYESAYELFLC